MCVRKSNSYILQRKDNFPSSKAKPKPTKKKKKTACEYIHPDRTRSMYICMAPSSTNPFVLSPLSFFLFPFFSFFFPRSFYPHLPSIFFPEAVKQKKANEKYSSKSLHVLLITSNGIIKIEKDKTMEKKNKEVVSIEMR